LLSKLRSQKSCLCSILFQLRGLPSRNQWLNRAYGLLSYGRRKCLKRYLLLSNSYINEPPYDFYEQI
jgi:hypothetical protein